MKQKVINISAWTGLISLIMTLLSSPLHLPVVFPMIPAFVSILFIFIPLFFFTRNKLIDQHYPNFSLKALQGLCFIILTLAPFFVRMHWPLATLLSWLGIVSTFVLIVSLRFTKQPKFRQPQVIALLVLIVMTSLTKPIGELSRNSLNEDVVTFYNDVNELNNDAIQEFNSYSTQLDSTHNQWFEANILMQTIRTQLIEQSDYLPPGMADTIPFGDIVGLQNTDIPNALLFHSVNNDSVFNVIALKESLTPFLSSNSKYYLTETKTILRAFNLNEVEEEKVLFSWEESQFRGLPLAQVLIKFKLFELVIQRELVIEKRNLQQLDNPELNEVWRREIVRKFLAYDNQLTEAYTDMSTKRKSFLSMLAITFLIILLLFFIPSLPLSENWKIRALLFCVIIIFEFVLLLVDSYLGIFLKNPAYVLGVNIILALGLVTLDNFLRNNFLNWYE